MKPIIFFILVFISNAVFSSEEIITHSHYILNYNEDHEVANWVAYELDLEKLQNCVKRSDSFKSDPLVSTGSANASDYRGSGFDRGHLLPAGDMKFNLEAMKDTFYFSNITPQPAKFNQGRWDQLENLIRAWALKYNKIWIVTGPLLRSHLPEIGKQNKVSVPETYFKVILRKTGTNYEGYAFLMDTDVPYLELSDYTTTINHVEELTGHDFFQFLNNNVEEKVEGTSNPTHWDFRAKFDYLPCRT